MDGKSEKQGFRSQVRQEISDGAVRTRVASRDLDYSNIKVYTITAAGHTFTSATVPVIGPTESPFSGLTVVYDSVGKLSNYAEIHVTHNASDHFQITALSNGNLVKDEDSGVAWVSNAATLSALHGQTVSAAPNVPAGWGEKVTCVAATLGVSYWVANIIVGLCGTTCATAETNPASATICAACITGIVAVGGGAITAVYKCMGL